MDAIITLTGNLGADPRIRTVGEKQVPVTEFSMAHTPRVRDGDDWKDGATTWYRVSCWRRLALNANGCLRRGDAVIVTGRLRPTEWVDQDGVVHRQEEIDAIAVGPDLSRRAVHLVRDRPRAVSDGPGQGEGSAMAMPDEAVADLDYLAGHEPDPEEDGAFDLPEQAYDRTAA